MKAKIAYNYYKYESVIESWPDGTCLVPHEDHKSCIYDKEKDDYIINGYYFEIYSKNPDSYFCSPSGKTFEEAEKLGYEKFLKYVNCKGHKFERRDYFRCGEEKCQNALKLTNLFSFCSPLMYDQNALKSMQVY